MFIVLKANNKHPSGFKSLLVRFYVSFTKTLQYNIIHWGKNYLLCTSNHSTIIFFAIREALPYETKNVRDLLFHPHLLNHEYIMPFCPVTLARKFMGIFLVKIFSFIKDGQEEVSIPFSHFNVVWRCKLGAMAAIL